MSDLRDRLADPTRCPDLDCNTLVPELYRLYSAGCVCRGCGRWELDTGVRIQPVAGPVGTPAEYVQLHSPFWRPISPAKAPVATRQQEDAPQADRPPLRPARHSKDFRSVHWFGTDYHFTPTQAACVKVLWEAWENGTPELAQETILEHPEVEAESGRLIDVFKNHPAWGTMIVKGHTVGAFRLAEPHEGS